MVKKHWQINPSNQRIFTSLNSNFKQDKYKIQFISLNCNKFIVTFLLKDFRNLNKFIYEMFAAAQLFSSSKESRKMMVLTSTHSFCHVMAIYFRFFLLFLGIVHFCTTRFGTWCRTRHCLQTTSNHFKRLLLITTSDL